MSRSSGTSPPPSFAATPPAVEIANGFMNSFLLASVRRIRLLPEGGDPNPLKGTGLARYLATVLKHARSRRASQTRCRHARAVVAHLPATHRTRRRARRPTHPPARKRTRSASRCSTRCSTASATHPARAPESSARALGLRRPLSRLGDRARDRRPARRTTPRRARPPPDGLTRTQLPDLSNATPRQARRTSAHSLAATGRAQQQRSSPPAAPPNSGPPREHPSPDPTAATREWVASLAQPRPGDDTSSRTPVTPSWRAINSESEAVSTRDAQPHRPRTRPPFIASRSRPTTTSVVRSFGRYPPPRHHPERRRHHHPECPSTPPGI